MTTRSLSKLVVLPLAVLAFSAGCGQKTPDQRANATKSVLNEVLGTSIEPASKPAENAVAASGDSSNMAPSIVKQQPNANEPLETQPEVKRSTPEASKQKTDPKTTTKNLVDDPSKSWINGITLPRETWEVQYLGNNPVGYFYHRVEAMEVGSVRHKAEGKLRVSIKGEAMEQHITMTSIESNNGELLSLQGSLEIGENRQEFKGKVNGDTMTLNGTENDKPFSVTIPWDRKFRGPFAVEQSMLRKPMQPRELRKLKYFDPLLRKLIDGRLESSDYIITPTMLGGVKELLEVRNIGIVGEEGSQALLWVDNRGEGFKSYVPENDVLSFRTLPIDAEVVASMADLRVQELVTIPVSGSVERLRNNSLKTITFEVAHKTEFVHKIFVDESAQRIRSADALAVNVTVYLGGRDADSFQDANGVGKQETNSRSPSAFIPSGNDRIIKRAKAMVDADKTISQEAATNFQKANACRREIQKRIGLREFDKKIGLFTNLLRSKQANCIEHALFLAAHCRALEVPTRIALGLKFNGMVEAPKMVFHAWVEIQDGKRWIPMDSSDSPSSMVAANEGIATIDRIKLKATDFSNPNPYLDILSICQLLPGFQIKVLPAEIP